MYLSYWQRKTCCIIGRPTGQGRAATFFRTSRVPPTSIATVSRGRWAVQSTARRSLFPAVSELAYLDA